MRYVRVQWMPPLPDLDQLDSEALKTLILALHEQVFSHRKQLTTQQEEILSQRQQLASRDAEIEHLKLLIAKLRRLQFGRSSEKREYQIEQLELRLEELETRRTKEAAAVEESASAGSSVARPIRRALPITCHGKCGSIFRSRTVEVS
jgi:transposase